MRAGGILLPVFSLPSPYGIGCFSKEAYAFVDFLKEAGQSYWQLLPLGPTGYGDSPYQPFSAFAGNPYFIDPEELVRQELLTEKELLDYRSSCGEEEDSPVDYGQLYHTRFRLLRRAFERARGKEDASFAAFCTENADWLEDYVLYMALKTRQGGKSWEKFEEPLRLRQPQALERGRRENEEEMAFHRFLQYQCNRQWAALKEYANRSGIRIIGDIPIYVSLDSADSWSLPELFQFDENRVPSRIAGCPPDAFAAEGQLWGNPLYDWDYHERTGYAWWIRRLEHCFEWYDVVRVDHFRGFDEYYTIPYGDSTARNGHWEKGPAMKLFEALKAHFGEVSIIAEDLGYLTPSVEKMVADTGYPGMKVMEFAFDSREPGDYMPYTYRHNCAVYTGTHDNQTLAAWYGELTEQDRQFLDEYLQLAGLSLEEKVWRIIRLTLACAADTAVIPMQDYLCLGAEGRMNRPSTQGNNWRWRMSRSRYSKELAERIGALTALYGRIPGNRG